VLQVPGKLHPVQSYFLEDTLRLSQFDQSHVMQAAFEAGHKQGAFPQATFVYDLPSNSAVDLLRDDKSHKYHMFACLRMYQRSWWHGW
jgi:hypothetical protein